MGNDNGAQPRQRLLYIHAQTPNPLSPVLEMTIYEPVAGFKVELTAEEPELRYATVHAALVDGWQIVQFHCTRPNMTMTRSTWWDTSSFCRRWR